MVASSDHVVLRDIRVEPPRLPYDHVHGGGPVADEGMVPEWAYQIRDGSVVGRPSRSSEEADRLEGNYVWGGWAGDHPGHFMAEHAPRILSSVLARPDDRVLFLRRSGADPATAPNWFWDILAWFGVDRDRVDFVSDSPVVVERLTVFPQAEHLTFRLDESRDPASDTSATPDSAYLDSLNLLFEEKGLEPWVNEHVYLSRAGLPGRFGGERHLEDVLKSAGVVVVRPENLSITEQVRLFAGARHLIFAEGSALHFRQLLGYRDQSITVLQRRATRKTAINQLRVRCSRLTYRPAVLGVVQGPYNPKYHIPQEDRGFPYTDVSRVRDAIRDAGVDVEAVWSEETFADELDADLMAWARDVSKLEDVSSLRCAYHAELSLMAMGAINLAPVVGRAIDPSRAYGHIQDNRGLEAELAAVRSALRLLDSGPVSRLVTLEARLRRGTGHFVGGLKSSAYGLASGVAARLPGRWRSLLGRVWSRVWQR